jgi:hypothetical protein
MAAARSWHRRRDAGTSNPRDRVPGSALPLAYFAVAHTSLAAALVILIARPELPGGHFLHPRMVAVVHLVTLGWISGSILGALYIVAPLALGMALRVGIGDWWGWAAFVAGSTGMVTHFWIGEYVGMVWSAALVAGGIGVVAARVVLGLPAAPIQWGVKLHVALACMNIFAAAALGALVGHPASRGAVGVSPASSVFAHAHLAAIGWALMMVVGMGYRLLPMILPARPPSSHGLATSAVLIESGLVLLVTGLIRGLTWLSAGALVIAIGLATFVRHVRGVVRQRLPRPPALPRRDWSAWQVHGAFIWLALAVGLGLVLTRLPADSRQVRIAWIYGVAGLTGGLAQVVAGMQGRLLPLYAYYRAMAARDGALPGRSSHALISSAFARAIFTAWSLGVPWLAFGLARQSPRSIRAASVVLLAGVAAGALHLDRMLRSAGRASVNGSARHPPA